MSFILVATDFSDVATNAVHYACDLAKAWSVPVTVLHSYILPISFDDNPMPVMPIDDNRQMAEDNIASLVTKLNTTYPGLQINSYVSLGDVTDSLSEYAEEHQPTLIIVGNSTEDNGSLWFDSNLMSALRNLPYPVMAIPPGYMYNAVSKICLACDYKQVNDKFPADVVKTLVNASGASLNVLNVDHDNRTFGTETPLEAEALHDYLSGTDAVFHFVDNEDVSEGISQFIEQNNIDWLLVIPHHHSFWEGLFHKSNTKAIVKNIHVPVIAIHEKE
jgi:nucleotide-binding universal stress UspA family protein